MNKPKLSVIIPIYNSDKTIKKCIDSIINQTFTDWECILLDDDSGDHSFEVCEMIAVKDKRFKFVHKFKSGVSDTRNIGTYIAKGDWITFIDSDDFVEPTYFQEMFDAVEIHPDTDVIKCGANLISEDGTVESFIIEGTKKTNDVSIYNQEYDIFSSNFGMYKSYLPKGIPFEDCCTREGVFFNLEVLLRVPKVYFIQKALYNHNVSANSLSTKSMEVGDYANLLNIFKSIETKYKVNPTFTVIKDVVKDRFMKMLPRRKAIDLVIPYVRDDDPEWQKTFKQFSPQDVDQDVNGRQRFSSDTNMFRYVFRGIEKFLPFIDTVHLLVSSESQVPTWLNKEKVHIVTHKDFIPAKNLPTFNSCTIEMFLKDIPGLSEKFIYTNDDIFFIDDLYAEDFFDESDNIKVDTDKASIRDEGIPVWEQIAINSYNLIYGSDADEEYYLSPVHVEHAFTVKLLEDVWKQYSTSIESSCSQFRSSINLNQYIYSHYAMVNGQYVQDFHPHRVLTDRSPRTSIESALGLDGQGKKVKSVAFNAKTGASIEIIKESLQKVLPNKSSYEID